MNSVKNCISAICCGATAMYSRPPARPSASSLVMDQFIHMQREFQECAQTTWTDL
jgi:hypothetical protein